MRKVKSAFLFSFGVFLLASCQSTGNVKIKGIAYNDKGSAVVYTKNNLYYVDELNQWPEKYINRQVIVTGDLLKVYDTIPIDTTINIVPQSRDGLTEIIKSPKYRVTFWGLLRKHHTTW